MFCLVFWHSAIIYTRQESQCLLYAAFFVNEFFANTIQMLTSGWQIYKFTLLGWKFNLSKNAGFAINYIFEQSPTKQLYFGATMFFEQSLLKAKGHSNLEHFNIWLTHFNN